MDSAGKSMSKGFGGFELGRFGLERLEFGRLGFGITSCGHRLSYPSVNSDRFKIVSFRRLARRLIQGLIQGLLMWVWSFGVLIAPAFAAKPLPATEWPSTDLPEIGLPATELPATELSAAGLSTMEQPSTNLPSTNLPSTNTPNPFQSIAWSYEGDSSPEHWGELEADFALCDRGQQQSPIALQAAIATDIPNLVFHYQPSFVNLLNNGRTLQVDYDPGSYFELNGDRFNLLQFHFHHPSEHRLEGQDYPMELHLVHRSATGQLAVIGIMIEAGPANAALAGVWQHLLPAYTPLFQTQERVDANQLISPTASSYHYSGSLTTPPCSEDVQWIVLDQTIQLSSEQISAFEALVPANNRPRQALNGRSLQLDSSM